MRHFLKYDAVPLLSMLVVCAFPCVFLFARNASEVPAASMAPFLVVFCINALLLFGLSSVFLRNVSRAAFWTDLAMLVIINFCFLAVQLKRFFPWLRDRYLLAVLLVILAAVFILLVIKKPDLRTGCLLMFIAFGSMIFIHGVQAIPAVLQSHAVRDAFVQADTGGGPMGNPGGPGPGPDGPQDHPGGPGPGSDSPIAPPGGPGGPGNAPEDVPGSHLPEQVSFGDSQPNVYYFLFDEYGGFDNLQNYYNYDNSSFLSELEDRGFSVAYHSRNTEAVATDTIVPNLLNLDYVVKVDESGHKKAQLRNNCQLYRMFARNGYQVNLINHVDYLGSAGCRVLTSHQTRRTISEYLMRNSLYHKFPPLRELLEQFFVFDYGANYRASLDNALEAGLNCWQETGGTPTLTVGYIQCPHAPTMVGRHGEELPFSQGWNWRDHSLYLDQLKFMNDYILDLVDTIQENDPEALVILQSDHGNRYAIHMVQLEEWTEYDPHVENPYMQNILNCVYYQGETFDIEGETGINTLRTVFSQVLEADLPPIAPVQDYSYGYEDEHS